MSKRYWWVFRAWCAAALFAPGMAQAAIADSLFDVGNCARHDTPPLDYVLCDDGLPPTGSTTANVGGVAAITVPGAYGDDGYTGLPPIDTTASIPGADPDGYVALDVDVSLPLQAPPENGYPLIVFMHGCCGGNKGSWKADAIDVSGEKWHYSNAWFASRGYVTVNYTSRGFATAPPNRRGSTGESQLDSRLFEINDFQHLACQIHAQADQWSAITGQAVAINPEKVVVTGGSYGGGFSWMAMTDPVWECTEDTGSAGVTMKLAAAAPRYGWTDLAYSLVPSGRHSALRFRRPATDGCASGPLTIDGEACANPSPVGVPKQSILAGLYGTGLLGASFPQSITDAFTCFNGVYPPDDNPLCNGVPPAQTDVLGDTLSAFMRDRSAYYQNEFFTAMAADASLRTPVFNAATLTDPLFPPVENHRMHNRLQASAGNRYPLQSYFGDYQHFVQNKAKEWADLCGEDRHICADEDYADFDFNEEPTDLAAIGVTSRLNRFIDHYAQPPSNPAQTAPDFDVTVALTVCPQKATAESPADEPGERFSAARFEDLTDTVVSLDTAQETLTVVAAAATNSSAGGGNHADPVVTSQQANKCSTRAASDPAPAGVAVYDGPVLEEDQVVIGPATVTTIFTAAGDTASVQLAARVYELLPDGSAVLADRGYLRLNDTEASFGIASFETFGNAWRFSAGNRIRIELAQDDSPFLKRSEPPSNLLISRLLVSLPVRSADIDETPGGGGNPAPAPAAPRRSGGGGGLPLLALGVLGLFLMVRRVQLPR